VTLPFFWTFMGLTDENLGLAKTGTMPFMMFMLTYPTLYDFLLFYTTSFDFLQKACCTKGEYNYTLLG